MIQGLITGQKLPKNAINKEKPNHQVIQIKLGAKLSSGLGLPKKQDPKTTKNIKTEIDCMQNFKQRIIFF